MIVREVSPEVRVIDISGEITAFSEKEISAARNGVYQLSRNIG